MAGRNFAFVCIMETISGFHSTVLVFIVVVVVVVFVIIITITTRSPARLPACLPIHPGLRFSQPIRSNERIYEMPFAYASIEWNTH